MLVYKFGGTALKNADNIRSLLPLIVNRQSDKISLVFSAMGKMTNAFEILLALYRDNDFEKKEQFNKIKDFHFDLIDELFSKEHAVLNKVDALFIKLEEKLKDVTIQTYDYSYDQIVSFGELLSSLIIAEYLSSQGVQNKLLDASDFIITNEKHRDAELNWDKTVERILLILKPCFEKEKVIVTQGFIGGTIENVRTTIGREGSDYSAAIIANCLNASELTVWKDVPGLLNADPKHFPEAQNLKHISYHETVELAYYGASVIHPRSLQPLKAKNIPLYIRSFINSESFSLIDGNSHSDGEIPSFTIKENQILFSISARDFGFIDAKELTVILELFTNHHFHIRLLQNSALNFSIVADENPLQLEELLKQLQIEYSVKYNRNLSLLTIRHLPKVEVSSVFNEAEILLELKSRLTQQFVILTSDLEKNRKKLFPFLTSKK